MFAVVVEEALPLDSVVEVVEEDTLEVDMEHSPKLCFVAEEDIEDTADIACKCKQIVVVENNKSQVT